MRPVEFKVQVQLCVGPLFWPPLQLELFGEINWQYKLPDPPESEQELKVKVQLVTCCPTQALVGRLQLYVLLLHLIPVNKLHVVAWTRVLTPKAIVIAKIIFFIVLFGMDLFLSLIST